MTFKLGYNTNGFASHSLLSAIDIIASHGYDSIGITIDHHALNPWDDGFPSQLSQVKIRLDRYQLASVVETGARFLLNPWLKHEPTLISNDSAEREIRIGFIEKCLDIASDLGSEAVSIWSGVKHPDIEAAEAWEWLVSGCRRLSEIAAQRGVAIAFEPEPGMFVENLSQFQLLQKRVDHPFFKLTLDLGHAFITEPDVCRSIRDHKADIVNVHLEDMKKNRHNHLFFGEGEMDFGGILHTLSEHYTGQVNIELSRNSHNAVETAARAVQFLERFTY